MLQIHTDNRHLIHQWAWTQKMPTPKQQQKKATSLHCGLSNKKQIEQVLFLCGEIFHTATMCREIPSGQSATNSLTHQENCISSKDAALRDLNSKSMQLVERVEGHHLSANSLIMHSSLLLKNIIII